MGIRGLLSMKKRILLILLSVIVIFVVKTLYNAGSFKTIENHFDGTTQRIDGIWGGEDITIDQTTGLAFVSSTDRWANILHHNDKRGDIFLLNLNNSSPKPINLTSKYANPEFHPHGISLWISPQGKKYLFTVNHQFNENTIEKFEFQDSLLVHLETFKDDNFLISPNDIVAVGERQFYFTNDHANKPSLMTTIKDFLQIGTAYVVYFDGKSFSKTAAQDIKYANGINVSNDGKLLFVASSSGNSIYVYDRNAANGQLTQTDVINTGTGVDNVEIDSTGTLWVGCHPKLLKFVGHAKDEKSISPSEIIKIDYKGKGDFVQKTIYINTGEEISASSVGAVWKNRLLIGPVFQEHLILGEIK